MDANELVSTPCNYNSDMDESYDSELVKIVCNARVWATELGSMKNIQPA